MSLKARTIVPGGWDWLLVRTLVACIDVKADYMLKTDDGVIINVVIYGAIRMRQAQASRPGPCAPRRASRLRWANMSGWGKPLLSARWKAQRDLMASRR